MPEQIMRVLIDLSGSEKIHTKIYTDILREDSVPGFTDNRIRNADGFVDGAPRKIVADLFGGGQNVSENYPISASAATDSSVVEANVPRQTRGQKVDTLTAVHDDTTIFDVAVANFKDTQDSNESVPAWDGAANPTTEQPKNPFDAVYPYNHVRETESGHLFEADDTPGAERIKEAHRSGTYYEIAPDGSRVTKIVRDDFTVVIGHEQVNIKGSAIVTIEGDCNFLTEGNFTHQVNGDYNLMVKGKYIERVAGEVSLDHHSDYYHNIGIPIDVMKAGTSRGNNGGTAKTEINGDNILVVKGSSSESVGDGDSLLQSTKQTITFGNEKSQIIGGFKYEEVAKNATQLVGGAHTLNVVKNKKEYVGGLSISRSNGAMELSGDTIELNPPSPIDE